MGAISPAAMGCAFLAVVEISLEFQGDFQRLLSGNEILWAADRYWHLVRVQTREANVGSHQIESCRWKFWCHRKIAALCSQSRVAGLEQPNS